MTKNEPQRKALGKGLHSLLPRTAVTELPTESRIRMIPVDQLRPNLNQPRQGFDDEALAGLAQSIARDGILQPLIARPLETNVYQIVAGERRWRAANIAGLRELPVIVRNVEEEKVLELALIENIQREDLDPIDLARALDRMSKELQLSHQEIGERTGKDRATITNALRLLQLPSDVQLLITQKKLSSGHARMLLKFEDAELQRQVAERCVAEGWSVRQIEEFARGGAEVAQRKTRGNKEQPNIDPNVKAAITEMEEALGTRVRIVEKGNGKGRIEIEYYSDDDLNRLYEMILRQ